MSCASCAASNEKELLKTKGILRASVNFATKKAYVEYDADVLSEEQVCQVIKDNGYDVEEPHNIEHITRNKREYSQSVHEMKMQNGEAGGHAHMEDMQKDWRAFLGSAIFSVPLLAGHAFEIANRNIFFGG